ncbi:hypothetical protein SAY87_012032 [Trapa incisa]|uniref:Uncharacterized protein n=1 Tax=Trapa incisa TaxID=236973 RepID=A0AAN7JJF1_9MYRT|nr:hypothetical protein SAY87_012032 [Trapa incisa]
MSRLLPGPSPYTSPVDFGETIYCRESSEDGIRSEIYIGMDKGQEQIEGVAARSIEWPISGVGIGLEMVGSDLTLDNVSEIVEETEQQNVFECTDKQINPEMEANIRGLSEEVGGDVRVNEMQGIVLSIEADDILEFSDKGTSFEARDVAVMECARVEEIKEGGLAKETTGFTEKLREEGRDHRRELRIVLNDGAEQEYKKAAAMSTEDVGTSVQAKDAGMKNKRKGIKKGKVEEKRAHELPKQNEKAIRMTTEGHLSSNVLNICFFSPMPIMYDLCS